MKNTLQIIVLTVTVFLMSGCTSFYSSSSKAMKQNGAPLTKSAATAPAAPAPVIPDIPTLEPVQTAQGTAPAAAAMKTASHSASPSKVDNPFANVGKLASLEELKPNPGAAAKVSAEPAIKVVRLPKVDAAPSAVAAKTSEIQQVSYEEPELSPLPSSPEALNVASTQTVPKDHWNGANNVMLETQPVKSNELTMTPTVLDVDKNPRAIESSPAGDKKDVSLPKSMTGSKPMDSGVYLEELPGLEPDASQTPSQPTGGNSTQDIPDEIFDDPGAPNGAVNNAESANSSSRVVIVPTELEAALDSPLPIQQCAAVAPIEQKFQIKSLTFVTSIRKLGDFTAVQQPYEFSPGQTLLLYMEFDNPNATANLRSGFEVKDSQGKQIAVQDNSSSVPTEEKTFFQYVKLALPADIAPGEYTIRVWGQPEGEQAVSASTLTFKVK